MSCLSHQWCPQCEQLIADMTCACRITCDRHGDVCTPVIPDGRHFVRYKYKEPHSEIGYFNQWPTGFYGRHAGDDPKSPPIWMTQKPGHPTKTPMEVFLGVRQTFEWRSPWVLRGSESIPEIDYTEGGGI